MSEVSLSDAFTLATRDIGSERVVAIDARELHGFLEVAQPYQSWIRSKLAQFAFVEGSDFEVLSRQGRNSSSRRLDRQYIIDIDTAKHLALVEGSQRGRNAREYFIRVERELRKRRLQEVGTALHLLSTPSEWTKRFGAQYYEALAMVTGLRYAGHEKGTPRLFGKITDEWVYQVVMPPDVLAELRARREGGQKLHQWLTEGGLQQLEQQIHRVTDLAKSSAGYSDFNARCTIVFNKPGQLGLIYPLAA